MKAKSSLAQGCEYFDNKQYGAAEEKLREALALEAPERAAILFRLAFCLEMQGRHEEAEALYSQVAAAGGPPALTGDALYRIGWMAMAAKDHAKALEHYKKASGIFKGAPASLPMYKEALYWMALSYENTGRCIKALSAYHLLENDALWFWDACFRKIKCFDKIGRYSDALTCCRAFESRYSQEAGAPVKARELYPHIKRIKEQLEKLFLQNA